MDVLQPVPRCDHATQNTASMLSSVSLSTVSEGHTNTPSHVCVLTALPLPTGIHRTHRLRRCRERRFSYPAMKGVCDFGDFLAHISCLPTNWKAEQVTGPCWPLLPHPHKDNTSHGVGGAASQGLKMVAGFPCGAPWGRDGMAGRKRLSLRTGSLQQGRGASPLQASVLQVTVF